MSSIGDIVRVMMVRERESGYGEGEREWLW